VDDLIKLAKKAGKTQLLERLQAFKTATEAKAGEGFFDFYDDDEDDDDDDFRGNPFQFRPPNPNAECNCADCRRARAEKR
jgi:hypothetical protein